MSETWLHPLGHIAAGYLRSLVPPFLLISNTATKYLPLQDTAKSLKQYLAAHDKHYIKVLIITSINFSQKRDYLSLHTSCHSFNSWIPTMPRGCVKEQKEVCMCGRGEGTQRIIKQRLVNANLYPLPLNRGQNWAKGGSVPMKQQDLHRQQNHPWTRTPSFILHHETQHTEETRQDVAQSSRFENGTRHMVHALPSIQIYETDLFSKSKRPEVIFTILKVTRVLSFKYNLLLSAYSASQPHFLNTLLLPH